jgi:hypothetical protein
MEDTAEQEKREQAEAESNLDGVNFECSIDTGLFLSNARSGQIQKCQLETRPYDCVFVKDDFLEFAKVFNAERYTGFV